MLITGSGGWVVSEFMQETELSSDSWSTLHSVCASSDAHLRSFRFLGGGRATPTYTRLRSSLCCTHTEEGGREGGAVMGKRDASKVIMCFTLKGAGACQSR